MRPMHRTVDFDAAFPTTESSQSMHKAFMPSLWSLLFRRGLWAEICGDPNPSRSKNTLPDRDDTVSGATIISVHP